MKCCCRTVARKNPTIRVIRSRIGSRKSARKGALQGNKKGRPFGLPRKIRLRELLSLFRFGLLSLRLFLNLGFFLGLGRFFSFWSFLGFGSAGLLVGRFSLCLSLSFAFSATSTTTLLGPFAVPGFRCPRSFRRRWQRSGAFHANLQRCIHFLV